MVSLVVMAGAAATVVEVVDDLASTPWQRSQHPTRKSSPQLTTPRDGLKPGDKKNLSIGVVLPHSTFQRRRYEKAIKEALFNMQRDPILHETFRHYHFTYDEVVLSTMHHSSSPTSEYPRVFRVSFSVCGNACLPGKLPRRTGRTRRKMKGTARDGWGKQCRTVGECKGVFRRWEGEKK
ncbi:hypothetical protein E2C01_066715 [Portunus trituberculatus]|uniref:Uncharacterized protein n=1 Tax=Portunus trituberculatus TaxID=210409 RepID=A0A5B7HHV9_PORTR|nr:hypothetical protein [Portunus trituberculatus]